MQLLFLNITCRTTQLTAATHNLRISYSAIVLNCDEISCGLLPNFLLNQYMLFLSRYGGLRGILRTIFSKPGRKKGLPEVGGIKVSSALFQKLPLFS